MYRWVANERWRASDLKNQFLTFPHVTQESSTPQAVIRMGRVVEQTTFSSKQKNGFTTVGTLFPN